MLNTAEIDFDIPHTVFRAYDIRGLVDTELTSELYEHLGATLVAMMPEESPKEILVGRDGRLSSPSFAQAFIRGLRKNGCTVTDIGMLPTPCVHFASQFLNIPHAAMITASHNPASYNGLKISFNHIPLEHEQLQQLYRLAREYLEPIHTQPTTPLYQHNILSHYLAAIIQKIKLQQPLKVVVDCGNSVAGIIAPEMMRQLGCEIIELFCDVDGRFPNHHPDPSQPKNLVDLQQAVLKHQADIGIAFDGDGDRIGVVDAKGQIIWPDQLMILFARDVLLHQPNTPIIFDVKCTRHLSHHIQLAGGQPILWKTGHSFIRHKMRELHAPFAGEMSGHLFFNDDWYGFDDAFYAAARLLKILSETTDRGRTLLSELPQPLNTPELKIDILESNKIAVIAALKQSVHHYFPEAQMNDLDGIRLDEPKGWILIRPSNTTAHLTLRFEADDAPTLLSIKNRFKAWCNNTCPQLNWELSEL